MAAGSRQTSCAACAKSKAKCVVEGVRRKAESAPPPKVGAGTSAAPEWVMEMKGLMKSMADSLAEIPPLLKSVKVAVDELRFDDHEGWAEDEEYEFAPLKEADLKEMERGIADLAEERSEYNEWSRRKWLAPADREAEDREREREEGVVQEIVVEGETN